MFIHFFSALYHRSQIKKGRIPLKHDDLLSECVTTPTADTLQAYRYNLQTGCRFTLLPNLHFILNVHNHSC